MLCISCAFSPTSSSKFIFCLPLRISIHLVLIWWYGVWITMNYFIHCRHTIFSTLYISKTVLSSLLCSVSFVTNRTPICVRVFSPSGPPTLSYLSVHLSWNQYYTALIMRALYYILTVKKTFAPPCSHISRVSWPILCLLNFYTKFRISLSIDIKMSYWNFNRD